MLRVRGKDVPSTASTLGMISNKNPARRKAIPRFPNHGKSKVVSEIAHENVIFSLSVGADAGAVSLLR